jgi:hypothetical protein
LIQLLQTIRIRTKPWSNCSSNWLLCSVF